MNTLFQKDKDNWAKIMQLTHNLVVSNTLLNCADEQLTRQFVAETGLDNFPLIFISWGNYGDPFPYEKGTISYINCTIFLKHGTNKVRLAWKSRSGRIYDVADNVIDCNDIEYWFEGLDAAACKNLMKDEWSIFGRDLGAYVWDFKHKYGIETTVAFFECANKQLSQFFEKKTGYKINKHVGVALLSGDTIPFLYEKGDVSKFNIQIANNNNWNLDYICWKSKSGRIYEPGDTDIDCSDIEFWFEKLDILLYNQQMFPKQALPFKLKDLGYELIINRLHMESILTITVRAEAADQRTTIIAAIDEMVNALNDASESGDFADGFVDAKMRMLQGDCAIEYTLVEGTEDSRFFKQLFTYLKKTGVVEKVVVD